MLEKGWCPEIFVTGDVLAKTADPIEYKNWKPICLQSTIYKILMSIVSDRMLHFALKNKIINEEQKGFCPVSGCFDHPGLLLNIIENFRQNEGKLYIIFIDFFNAYGSVDHRRLLEVLKACKILPRIISLIEATLKESSYRIHTGFGPTDPITLFTGLKQGDPAAPVLFIIFLEVLVRVIKKYCVGYQFKYPFLHNIPPSSNQEFADDMVFTTDEEEEVHLLMDILTEFDKWSNMKVNASKCGFIAVSSDGAGNIDDLSLELKINNDNIPNLEADKSYKYLGFYQNVMGTHYDTANHMKVKMETNMKIIDELPIHGWHKVTLTQWLINSIPMYYLVNGRVHVSRFKKWNLETRKMIRKWIGARKIANSIIHLPTNEHGLSVMDIEDINDERKITVFTQFLHSNNERLRESTIANIRTELG
jgi:hypothetical protein